MKYVNKFIRNIPKNSIFLPNSEYNSYFNFFHEWHHFVEYDLRKKECLLRVNSFPLEGYVSEEVLIKRITLSEFILNYNFKFLTFLTTSDIRGIINNVDVDREYLIERHLRILQDNAVRELTLKNHSFVCYNDIEVTKGK